MKKLESVWRTCRIVVAPAALLVGLACAGSPGAASAAETKAVAASPALPETVTRENARDLLSRLSDEQVRSLLLEQLDRAAAGAEGQATTEGGMRAKAGMAGMVDQHAGSMRDRYTTLYDAFFALPATLRELAQRIGDADGSGYWRLAASIAMVLVGGGIVEALYRFALRRYRLRLEAPAGAFSARAFQLAVEFLLDFGRLVVFTVAAVVVFFAFWVGNELQRIVVLEVLFAVVVVRVTALIARFLLVPTPARGRLLPLPDRAARDLLTFALAISTVFAGGVAAVTIVQATNANAEAAELIAIGVWLVGICIALWTTWRVRKPIADLIRADSHSVVVGWLAELWPVIATGYFLALLLGGVFNLLAGTPVTRGTGFASLLLVMALPIVDMAFCRSLAAWVATARARSAAGMVGGEAVVAYEPIFRRVIHIIVIVVGMLLLARLWDLDLFAFAQRGLGGKIAGSLLSTGIVLLATYMVWEIVNAAINRRLAVEGPVSDDLPATRLRTVLPILRATIFVTIVVMAMMSILAGLGVDILPLIAGAGVVGVAIGFGSQTLVRDIVSGAFFLMDDAFRLGEYIEVGDAKGRIEKINLRSVFLRHHRGPINILPYGEIKRLRNTSRDWQVHVLEFRLPYETSMLQVKKIVKQIGDELAADADYANDILAPLKSVGVMSAEDSAVLVRVKFTARPVNNQWVIRRVAYDKIIRAFRAAGIRFAHRQVTVVSDTPESAAAAGGAALAIEPTAKRTEEKLPLA